MAVEEYAEGTWEATGVADPWETVETVAGPGVFVAIVGVAPLTGTDEIEVGWTITTIGTTEFDIPTGPDVLAEPDDTGPAGAAAVALDPVAVANNQSAALMMRQPLGSSTTEVPYLIQRVF